MSYCKLPAFRQIKRKKESVVAVVHMIVVVHVVAVVLIVAVVCVVVPLF